MSYRCYAVNIEQKAMFVSCLMPPSCFSAINHSFALSAVSQETLTKTLLSQFWLFQSWGQIA
jgi:hypothetical protein